MAAPSEKDLYDAWKAELLDRRPDLAPVHAGSVLEMLGYGAVAPASRLIGYSAERAKTMFLDGASGEDLTVRADDYFNVQRQSGAYATADVTFTRTGGNAGTLEAGFRVATVRDIAGNEVTFSLQSDLVFLASDTSLTGTVQAEAVGTAGNVAAAEITRLLDTAFDASMTCSNAAVAAGGADAETDEELRERCRQKIDSVVRGVLGALETGARTVASVKTATAVEDSAGLVTVYIADANGNSNAGMVASVETALAGVTGQAATGYVAAGAGWSVVGATLYTAVIDLTVHVRPGIDATAYYDRIRQAVVARLNKLRAGEPGDASAAPDGLRHMIRQAAMNVDIDNIVSVVVNTPAAPYYPTAGQIVRTTTGDITFT